MNTTLLGNCCIKTPHYLPEIVVEAYLVSSHQPLYTVFTLPVQMLNHPWALGVIWNMENPSDALLLGPLMCSLDYKFGLHPLSDAICLGK